MKRERSLRRIEDEKVIRKNKQMEIDLLKREIEEIEEEKDRLEGIIQQYQPHLDLLTQVNHWLERIEGFRIDFLQIVDRTDRFHSIDEMIEKFDVLYASYQVNPTAFLVSFSIQTFPGYSHDNESYQRGIK